jgi:hypothetical protein
MIVKEGGSQRIEAATVRASLQEMWQQLELECYMIYLIVKWVMAK